ncbi:MAG: lysophospholipase [Panacagrimonas sp.]|jgi:alpha-beta hydrolase superfamily lysophospholipase|nr:alpha/beta hydrolase [Panacagrimonas sp.]MCC2657913.1 lysophospholipase [Panacagrimonas sp.]
MKHREGRFKGKKDIEIFWQSWVPERPRAVVVLVHGLGEHSGRYRHVADALVGVDCAVYAMDHRGHGKSGGDRALIDRFAHAVEDIDHVVEIARREQPRKPVFMLGHSMGGALSLSYTIKKGDNKLAALILSGPAVALDAASTMTKIVAKMLSSLAPKAGLVAIDPSLVSRDASVVADYANDPLNAHGKVGARTLGEIVYFVEMLPAALPMIKLPLLVMHGRDDKLAGVAGSEMVVRMVSSKDKTLKVYDGLYHEIFNELPADRAVVLKDLTDWIKARV